MTKTWNTLLVVHYAYFLLVLDSAQGAEDFPSLISQNATLAIVLDRDYLGDEYPTVLDSIKAYMKELTREELKNGGVNVHYYSWTRIAIRSDVTAILSIANCKDTWELYAVARVDRVALLAITTPDCPRLPRSGGLSVPLVPKGEELPQLVLDSRAQRAFDWKATIVLHDDTLSRDMISRVAASLTVDVGDIGVSAVSVSIFKMKHENNDVQRRKEIRRTLSKFTREFIGENYIIIVTTDVMMSVLEVARSMKLVHPLAQWLFMVSDTDAKNDNMTVLSKDMGEGENVAVIYNVTSSEPSCQSGLVCHCKELLRGFVLGLDQAIIDEVHVAAQVSDEEWESIRPNKLQRGNMLVEHIEKYLTTNSVCNNCSTWKFKSFDVWGTSFQSKEVSFQKELLQVGFWRPVDGMSLSDVLFPHVVNGFRGRHLPIMSIQNPPWSMLTYNESGSLVGHSGLVFDIVNELSRNLNFTYYIILPKQMGEEFSNHTHDSATGIIFETKQTLIDEAFRIMESRNVLIAATAFTITEDRKKIINFTMPVSIQTYSFLVSRPRELSRVLLFMAPFSSNTWLCLGFSVVLMGPALFVIHRLSPFYDESAGIKRGGLSSIHNCFWYMYGALLQQGGMYLPMADSGRLIVGTWWLVVLVMVTTYCGNLVAFLTFPRQEAPITTVRELLNRKASVTWSMRKGTYLETVLKEIDDPKYKAFYAEAMINDGETKLQIDQVVLGKHALVDWKINLQAIMKKGLYENDRCDFALSTEEFAYEKMAMALTRNSPYTVMIDDEIKRMHQVGLIEKWLKEYLPGRDKCWNVGKVAEVNNHTVNMDDMQGCFFVLIIGFFGALCLLFLEWFWKQIRIKIDERAIKPYAE